MAVTKPKLQEALVAYQRDRDELWAAFQRTMGAITQLETIIGEWDKPEEGGDPVPASSAPLSSEYTFNNQGEG